jgi:hypothetical protein
VLLICSKTSLGILISENHECWDKIWKMMFMSNFSVLFQHSCWVIKENHEKHVRLARYRVKIQARYRPNTSLGQYCYTYLLIVCTVLRICIKLITSMFLCWLWCSEWLTPCDLVGGYHHFGGIDSFTDMKTSNLSIFLWFLVLQLTSHIGLLLYAVRITLIHTHHYK